MSQGYPISAIIFGLLETISFKSVCSVSINRYESSHGLYTYLKSSFSMALLMLSNVNFLQVSRISSYLKKGLRSLYSIFLSFFIFYYIGRIGL